MIIVNFLYEYVVLSEIQKGTKLNDISPCGVFGICFLRKLTHYTNCIDSIRGPPLMKRLTTLLTIKLGTFSMNEPVIKYFFWKIRKNTRHVS